MSDSEHETVVTSFDCCGVTRGGAEPGCACGSVLRRHRFVSFVICTVMMLVVLLIPVGAILGIVAFLRTL